VQPSTFVEGWVRTPRSREVNTLTSALVGDVLRSRRSSSLKLAFAGRGLSWQCLNPNFGVSFSFSFLELGELGRGDFKWDFQNKILDSVS